MGRLAPGLRDMRGHGNFRAQDRHDRYKSDELMSVPPCPPAADLQNLAGSIGGMTGQFARGELPQAKKSFSSFEMSLPAIPSR